MERTDQIARLISIAVLTTFLLLSYPVSGVSERGIQFGSGRYALVIGNGAYPVSPLKNPANDSEDVARLLVQLGFTVIHRHDVGIREMEVAVRDFGRMLNAGGTGVFYFAGHGIQVKGRNYLIPVDAKIESESDVRYEALDVGRVLGKMEDAGNVLNIVIQDACRDNPFARGFRSARKGLARMDAPRGTLIAYATAPGSIAADGTGRNGVYTRNLLAHMATPGLPVEQVFKNVRIGVIQDSNQKQVPWESSSLTVNFSFAPTEAEQPKSVQDTALPGEPKDASRKNYEMLFWESIKDSSNPALFQAYLQKYPDGLFSEIAQIKIQGMKKPQAGEPPETVVEQADKKTNKPVLAYAQDVSKSYEILLRRWSTEKIYRAEIDSLLAKYDFYESSQNPQGAFQSRFIEENENTVVESRAVTTFLKFSTNA
jgi:uncharacterized caspase-like protein